MWMEVEIEGREVTTWTRRIVVEVPDETEHGEVFDLGADSLNNLTSAVSDFEREGSTGIDVRHEGFLNITVIEQDEDGQPDVIFARDLDDILMPVQ